jgi:hypothetical protein
MAISYICQNLRKRQFAAVGAQTPYIKRSINLKSEPHSSSDPVPAASCSIRCPARRDAPYEARHRLLPDPPSQQTAEEPHLPHAGNSLL